MLSQPEPACLLIADISGYTSYLAGSELDHAQDVLADLMTTVVGALRPAFRLAKLEGDAAFVYVLAERLDGSQPRHRGEDVLRVPAPAAGHPQATACECNACVLMPRLDLKVLAHHGSIIRHRVAGREELVGSDVIVAHRLLKNHVVERLGTPAYAMFSDACISVMDVEPAALGMTESATSTRAWARYWLGARPRRGVVGGARSEARRRHRPGRRVCLRGRPAGPARHRLVVHDGPGPAPLWQVGVEAVDQLPTSPRRGVGTTNHCIHGADVLVEQILDWRPTDYVTHRTTMPQRLHRRVDVRLRRQPGRHPGQVAVHVGQVPQATRGAAGHPRVPRRPRRARSGAVARRPTEEMARRAALIAEAPPEPAAPASLDREIREPVRR